jgi:glycosyltransferase involved in cell wall biosynthesis
MRRARILHLRASNLVGGPEQQLLRYAQLERDSEFELILGSFVGPGEGSDFMRAAADRGLNTATLPASNLASSLHALVSVVHERKIKLLCAHGYKADILGIAAGRLAGIPVACFLRGWTGENRNVRLYEGADKFSLFFADRIVCLSNLQANKFTKHKLLANKIRVISNAIDIPGIDGGSRIHARSELRRRLGLPPACRVVASGGRLSPEKGVGDFLQAISLIADQFIDTRFVIFGEGALRLDLEKACRALGITNQAVFAGFQRDLRGLLPGVDLLVNPSHSEEMPNIVLEAMAARVPVVATRVGGVEEISGDGALRLVPPGKPTMLANEISLLLSDPALMNELGSAGQMRAKKSYSLGRQRSEFHAFYEELIARPRMKGSSDAVEIPLGASFSSKPPFHTGELQPFLTIVMPVRNEERHLSDVLSQLESQTYPHDRFEILVADGNSTDATAKMVEEFARKTSISVRLLENPDQLSSAGRNVGARNSRGEFVIYLDGHCHIPNASMLQDTVDLFEKTGADCLCRPQPLTMPGNTSFQNVVANVRATALGHGLDSTIYSGDWEGPANPSSSGASYRRSVFERIGHYDENFDACEDVEFNFRVFRAGLRSYLSPRLEILYQPRPTLRSLWQQMIRYGRGRYRLIRKHPRAFSAGQVIPTLFVMWFILTGAGSFYSSYVSLTFLGTLFLYLAVVLGFSAGLAVRYGWRYLIQAPTVYAVIHFGLGAGFLMELVSDLLGRRKSRNKRVDAVSASVEPCSSAARNEVESNSKRAVAKTHEFAEHQMDLANLPRAHHG